MAKLSIQNIGPIESVDITLHRVNVFIGPQGSGKSTIAKILSFCQWLEKNCVRRQSFSHVNGQFVTRELIDYHNMEGYFREDSSFVYQGEAVAISYRNGTLTLSKEEQFPKGVLAKVAYIPAERNLISIPGIFATKMPYGYVTDFLDSWQSIRNKYTNGESTQILNLDQKYRFDSDSQCDILVDNRTGQSFTLSSASSGMQSVTPLCVMMDYITDWIYKHEEDSSSEERKNIAKIATARYLEEKSNLNNLVDLIETSPEVRKSVTALAEEVQGALENPSVNGETELMQHIREIYRNLSRPAYSNIVVEEPEQNLFPTTQTNIVNFLLSKINHTRDMLTITTHSPYILYALNNAMLAFLTMRELEADSYDELKEIVDIPESAFFDPRNVAVWELREGAISGGRTIQDEAGLIRDNYFDRIMRNVMADFRNLLSAKD